MKVLGSLLGGGVLDARFDAASLHLLRCEVSDAGPGAALWPARPGHGLWVARQVAGQVTVLSGPAGFRVTAVFASRG